LNAWLETITDLSVESNEAMLAVGAVIVQEIRQDIFKTLGYHCSAGLAHNKVDLKKKTQPETTKFTSYVNILQDFG
jgi:nucleotidyltransferase/DNA polymerase involved in DNA repair